MFFFSVFLPAACFFIACFAAPFSFHAYGAGASTSGSSCTHIAAPYAFLSCLAPAATDDELELLLLLLLPPAAAPALLPHSPKESFLIALPSPDSMLRRRAASQSIYTGCRGLKPLSTPGLATPGVNGMRSAISFNHFTSSERGPAMAIP